MSISTGASTAARIDVSSAVLRIAEELERQTEGKVSQTRNPQDSMIFMSLISLQRVWFLCPTVALATQQARVLQRDLAAYPCRLLCGNDGVDAWTEQSVWDDALFAYQIIVCTHDVLKGAFVHAFVRIASICLLVFDEAHHCANDHPSKLIMDFYHLEKGPRPSVLGLTASPVVRKKGEGLQVLERNLNAVVRTPKMHRQHMLQYVHPPVMAVSTFLLPPVLLPSLYIELERIYHDMDIEEDPWLRQLEHEDPALYCKTLLSRKTYSQDLMKRLVRTAERVSIELGPSLCELYIMTCVTRFLCSDYAPALYEPELGDDERAYVRQLLEPLSLSFDEAIRADVSLEISPKISTLLQILSDEMDEHCSCIIFVETRAEVFLIDRLLSTHPLTRDIVRSGTFIGMADSSRNQRGGAFELLDSR